MLWYIQLVNDELFISAVSYSWVKKHLTNLSMEMKKKASVKEKAKFVLWFKESGSLITAQRGFCLEYDRNTSSNNFYKTLV